MKHSSNAAIRQQIERNAKLFRALRRSDITMQLRYSMVAKGIRSIDVAERLGVSEANVSRWLKGTQNLSLDTLYLLADAIEEPLTLHVGAEIPAVSELEPSAPATSEGSDWSVAETESGDNVISLQGYRRTSRRLGTASFAPAKSKLNGDLDELAEAAA